jgi:6-phosphofructokinase 1
VDRREARRLGAAAVRSALQGASGQEVVLLRNAGRRYGCRIGLAPLEDIANAEKRVPAGMFDARAMLPTRAFRDYALPLLGPALPEYPRVVRATRLRPALKRVGPVTRRGR